MARSSHSEEQKEQAVRLYLQGEPVRSLAKQFKISVPGMYLWIKNAREDAAEEARRSALSPTAQKKEDEVNLKLRVQHLENENALLKKRLFDLMIETGKI